MAWFGSGISQITGQISNFTKEVLTEGTEEVDDHATELRLSKSRLAEMENYCETQKGEGQKLERQNKELAEKLEAAELQVSAISTQYRESLSQKDEEIRGLKQQLNELHHLESQLLDESLLSPVSQSVVSGFGHGDEHDFDDLVTSQHEINRLRSKVQRLQAECHRWQQAQQSQAAGNVHNEDSNGEDGDSVASLQRQVKDLQQRLASCVDQNQHELAALQDLHAQKLSAATQRQKAEARAHEEKVASLIEQLHTFEIGSSTCGHEKELSMLKEQARHLEEINGKISTDLEQMHAADREKGRLLGELREQLKQLEDDHVKVKGENEEMLSQRVALLAEVDALTEERQTLKMTLHELNQQQSSVATTRSQSSGDVTSQSHDHVTNQSDTQKLQQQVKTLTNELDACRQEIDEFDLVKSDWAMEKEALEEVLLTMREQQTGKMGEEDGKKDGGMKDDDVSKRLEAEQENVARLKKDLQENAVSASELDGVKRELEASKKDAESTNQQLQEKRTEMGKLQRRLNESEQEVAASNEKITSLSKQLEALELVTSENFEQEVDSLRKQLKVKNEELMDVNVELEEVKTLVAEQEKQMVALKAHLEEQSLELENAGAEKEQLSSSIEELDVQHEEAMSQVISARHNLQQENKELKERCAALESAKLANETRQTSNVDTIKSGSKEEVKELKEKLDKAAMSLNELHMDKKELENETTSLKQKIADLQKKLKTGRSEITSLKQKNLELEIDVTSAREELSLLKQSVTARDDLGQLRKEFEESWNESARKKMSTELHEEVAMLKADLAAAMAEKEVATRQLDQLKNSGSMGNQAAPTVASQSSVELLSRIDLLQNQNESLEKLLNDTEEKLAEIKPLYDAQIVMTEGHIAQVKQLNQRVDSLSQEKDALEKRLQEESQRYQQEKEKSEELEAKVSSLEARCVDFEKSTVMLDESLREKRDIVQAWEESKGFIATLRVENEGLLRDKEISTKLIQQQRVEIERLGKVEPSAAICEDTKEGSAKVTSDGQIGGHTKQSTDVVAQSGNSDRMDQVNGSIAVSKANMAELENLRKIITLKDNVVMELKMSNASLMHLLEERSLELHGNRVLIEIHELGAQVTSLRREKEQMMSVLNEKTRDCSSLRAEVHRLMSVVSAQKVALSRMQNDNNTLQRSASVTDAPVENSNNEMSREAIKQLSQVIRNKDVEIEALRQKSDTLIAVLQEQTADGAADQISTLMRERDNLAKQISVYVDDRNQIVAALNNKHEECVAYHAEAGRLAELLASSGNEHEKLEHEYEKLKWEFENKKQALLKVQNELVGLRQKCSESNRLYLDLKQSGVRLDVTDGDNDAVGQNGGQDVQKLMVIIENQRAAVCEKDEIITKSTMALQEKEQRLLEFDQSLRERDRLLSEKEKSINELRVQLHRAEESASQKETQLSSANKQQQHSTFQLQGLQTEVVDLRSKCAQLSERNDVLQTEMNNLRETHGRVSRAINDKEFELAAAHEKINSLSQLAREDSTPGGASGGAAVETLMREKEAIHQQVSLLRQERDQLVSALQQTQVENEQLQGKILQLSEREQKLTRELDRLRNHLLAIEENYTREAIDSEEREKELRNRLAQAEERLLSSSSLVESASQQASQQVETLQLQLHVIAEQRDGALLQLASSQEMANQYATSLANLQMVLEQFQHERDLQQAADVDRCQKELKASHKELRQLKQQLTDMQEQLDEKTEALEAASRLSEQLDHKEEMIHALREEVQLREKELTAAEEKIAALSGSREAKVDKALVKNLLIGYFHTPSGKRIEVLKLMCKVLDFNAEEMQQIGAETNSSWLGGFLRKVTPTTPTKTNKSFSQLFVNFLETESTPKAQPRLPAEAMAEEQHQRQEQRHQKHTFNPFTAAVSTPTSRHMSAEDSHLLMRPIAASLPMFTPIVAPAESTSRGSSGRSTPASSTTILRDVLQQ